MKMSVMAGAALCLTSLSAVALDDKMYGRAYEVTVTNITKGQSFTPILAMSHLSQTRLFSLASPASEALEVLAEAGDVQPFVTYLSGKPHTVGTIATTDGLLGPGESVSFEINTTFGFGRLSLAAMMIPTNDTFVALNNARIPAYSAVYYADAYDAGTEVNDEACASIPGPFCGGEGYNVEGGEGFVHVANGVAGAADLDRSSFDWRSNVAQVVIRLIPQD